MSFLSTTQQTISGPTFGIGPQQIGLLLAEDMYAGDVQVTISVNGIEIGGVQTITAQQVLGTAESFTLKGSWSTPPTVSINFLNDAWNGSTGNGNDRNLYIDGVSYNGALVSNSTRTMLWNGPTFIATTPVARATDFLNTIGVTTHLLYGDTSYHNEPLVLASLAYLGVTHVRDGGSMLDPNAVMPLEQAMAAGIKLNFTASPDGGVATDIARLHTLLVANPNGITSIEGINEAQPSLAYGGAMGQAAALRFQQDLFTAIKADPALTGIPVINYTLLSQDPTDYTRYGDVSASADFGNIHLYPYGGLQTLTSTLLPRELEGTPQSGGFVITEFGYDTISNADIIQAKYMLDGLLDAFQVGASATYIYELLDDNSDQSRQNIQDHFGLFQADGTPKVAAIALHNLTTILADPGANTFTPGRLGYQLTGLPATGSSLLLAKSDGSFDLAVWAEPMIRASATTPEEVTVPSTPTTISFDQTEASVEVYDPLIGSSPIASYTNRNSITLMIADHPLIIEARQLTDTVPPIVGITQCPSGITNLTSALISGYATDGQSGISHVEIFNTVAGKTISLGYGILSSNGQWSLNVSNLSNGAYNFSAIATDSNSNSSAQVSAGATLTVDTIKPQPFIRTVIGNRDGGVTVSGITEAGATSVVSETIGLNTITLGTVSADANGRWQLTTHTKINMSTLGKLTVSSQDQAGNIGIMSGSLFLSSNGNDYIVSMKGAADVFSLMTSTGSDVISGFETSASCGTVHDYLNFSGRGISSFSQLRSSISGTTSTTITIGSAKSVTLVNVPPSSISASDFIFS